MNDNRFLRFAMKPVVVGLLMFFSLLLLTQVLVRERYLLLRETELRKLNDEADAAKERLQSTLNSSFSCTQTLAVIVERYGVPKDFDSLAKRLLGSDKLIDELELVRRGVITNIYPLKGNEPAIGYDILKDSVRNRGAYVAMRTKEFFFAGPTYLKQGGIGVIGRQPIFINGKFWGFSAVIIRLPSLLKAAGIDSIGNRDFTYQLARVDPQNGSEEYFLPDHFNYNDENSVPVDIPKSEWKLYVREKSNLSFWFMLSFSLMGLVLSFTGGTFTWFITRQPQALKKLVDEKTAEIAASEEKYRTLIEHAGDAIFVVNLDTTFLDVNTSASKLMGYTRDELLQMKISDLYSQEELAKNPLRWDLLQKNKSLLSERKLKRKDGVEIPVEINSKLQDGKGFLAIVRDITERKKIEEQLKENKQQLTLFIEHSPVALAMFDMQMRYLATSNRWKTDYHLENVDLIGKYHYEVVPDLPQRWKDAHQRCLKGAVEKSDEDMYLEPDGKQTWLRWEIRPWYKGSGDIGGMVMFTEFITERKKAEEAVIMAYKEKEVVLNRISDSVVSLDNDWRYTFLNDGALSTHPLGREGTIGRIIWDVHPEMKGTIFWDKYHEAMQTRKVTEIEDYYAPLDTWFSVKIYPSADGLTIFYKDITESKKAEQEIIREKNLSASIINSLPGVFYLYDENGKFVRWNKNFETVSGYSYDEVSRMHPLDFFDESEKELLETKIAQVFEKGFEEVEAPFLTKDKRKIPYFFNGHLANLDGKDYLIGMGIDITAREKAQQEMLLEKTLSESVINSMPGIFYLANFDGQLLRWNKNFETVSGYGAEEIGKMRLRQFVAPEELEGMLEEKQKVFEVGMADMGANFVTKAQAKIPYYFTNRRAQYNGQPCLLGVGIDITERKKAEEQIIKNEQKYRSLIEQASDPIMVTDFEGNFTDVNTSLCKIFGYTKDELLQLNIATLIDAEDLKDRPIRFDLLATGQHIINDRRMIRRDGTIIEVEANVKKVDDNYVMAIARDVTQLRQAQREIQISEARFRGAFEFSASGMALATLEGKWMKVNNRLSQITGYSEEELLGLSFREITHPDDVAGDVELVEQLRNGQIPGFQREKRYIHKNGDPVWVNVSASLVKDPQGVPLYFVAQIENINERKRAEQEKEHARYLLNERVKELTTLYKTGRILQTEHLDTGSVLQQIVDILPAGWQFPEICAARITVGTNEFKTNNYRTSRFCQTAQIANPDGINGTIEIVYLEEKPFEVEGPFLAEERNLINMLAEMIRVFLNQKHEAEELNSSYKQLRQLSSHLQTVREEERAGISREIHDELGQQLTGLKMDTAWLKKKIAEEDAATREKVDDMLALIDETVTTVRRISSELRPGVLDDLGLVAALEWQSSEFERRTGVRSKFSSPSLELDFEKNIAIGIFRVYQEALTNVTRHSNATMVETVIEKNADAVVLRVTDNGSGFDTAEVKNKKTLGLVGMKERALMFNGELNLESEKGKGTTIILKVPLALHSTQS